MRRHLYIISNILSKTALFTFVNLFVLCCAKADTDYHKEGLEKIYEETGSNVDLKCGINNYDVEYMTDSDVLWFFKPCIEYENDIQACESSRNSKWIKLPSICGGKNDNSSDDTCKPAILRLQNLTESYSGFYKCSIYPYKPDKMTTLEIRLIKIFRLQIFDSTAFHPHFIDGLPLNQTISVGSQGIFECRVYSKIQSTIKWFKKVHSLSPLSSSSVFVFKDSIPIVSSSLSESGFIEYSHPNIKMKNKINSAHFIKYLGNVYELLTSGREKILHENVYLSKFILKSAKLSDTGNYACVAINYRGHNIREAYLNIITENNLQNEYNNDENTYDNESYQDETSSIMENSSVEGTEKTHSIEFVLLFLMPISLALVPIVFWILFKLIRSKIVSNPLRKDLEEEQHFNRRFS